MTESPRARRVVAPGWAHRRLVAGVVLVLVSLVGGAKAVAAAGATVPVYAARHDLAAGTVLRATDVEVVSVRLARAPAARYVRAGVPVVGGTLRRDVGAGELLPAAVLSRAGRRAALVSVTVPSGHVPPVASGARVDVYATDKGGAGESEPATRRVVSGAVVDSSGTDPAGGVALRLRVDPANAAALVHASATADLDVVVAG